MGKKTIVLILLTLSFYGGWQSRGGFEAFKSNPIAYTFHLLTGK